MTSVRRFPLLRKVIAYLLLSPVLIPLTVLFLFFITFACVAQWVACEVISE